MENAKKYIKPKCDCGTFLKARRNECWIVTRNITKNGKLSDKTVKINTSFDDAEYEIKLHCTKCGNIYEADYDNKDRLIRADKI